MNTLTNFHGTHLLGGPLESSDAGVLDLIEVLDSLCAVNQNVGSVGVGAEAPDLPKTDKNLSRH